MIENATEISFMVRRIFFSQEARSVDLLLHNTHKRIHKPVGTFEHFGFSKTVGGSGEAKIVLLILSK